MQLFSPRFTTLYLHATRLDARSLQARLRRQPMRRLRQGLLEHGRQQHRTQAGLHRVPQRFDHGSCRQPVSC